jgi:Swt1-like HEPN
VLLKTKINDFVFTGILTSHCIRDVQSRGLLRTPAGTAEERREQDLFAPVPEAIRGGSIQMQRWYRLLFVFENLVRDFIITRLRDLDGENWFTLRATADMRKKVEDRRKEEKNLWHSGRNQEPLFYLDFGDLGLLITNHWTTFKDFFDNQAWIVSRIQDAERTRNVIAHTNVLASEEGERLEMYLRDFLRQIG